MVFTREASLGFSQQEILSTLQTVTSSQGGTREIPAASAMRYKTEWFFGVTFEAARMTLGYCLNDTDAADALCSVDCSPH